MYALARNSWKFLNRDKRIHKVQKVEFDPFAPDTIEEIISARRLLEIWIAKADLRNKGLAPGKVNEDKLAETGRNLLSGNEELECVNQAINIWFEFSKFVFTNINTVNTQKKVGDSSQVYFEPNVLPSTCAADGACHGSS